MRPALPCSLLASVLLLSACHGGGSGGAAPAPEAPGFTLAVAPASLSGYPGSTASTTATLVRTGGFTGAVALGLQEAPGGLAATGLVPEGATSARLQVVIPAGLAVQTWSLTVSASGGGLVRTAPLTLVLASGLALLPQDRVSAGGGQQRSAGGGLSQQVVVQEPYRATTAATGQVEHKTGFTPTAQ